MAHSQDLYHRWSLEMRRSRVLSAGERVGVAVSGGPDSVLLLHFMLQFAAEHGLCLSVVHFNHHLRGAESNQDEAFVKAKAADLGIGFLHAGGDTGRRARESKKNLEAAAREQRYRFFFSLIRQGKLDKIVTAHTASDQAETVLLRLFRGAGTRGLGGIFPVLEGKIVRPFLAVTRAEVEQEIERSSLVFHVDRSNADLRFARNRIRRDVLPLIEREFNPGIVPLLKQMADRARDDEAYLEQQAAAAARPWRLREGGKERIPIQPFSRFPVALQRRVLRQMIADAGGLPAPAASHIEAVRRFAAAAPGGKTLTLPGGIEARKEFGWLAICLGGDEPQPCEFSISILPPAEVPLPGDPGCRLKVHYETAENPRREPLNWSYNSNQGSYLDVGTYEGPLILRNWRAGDRFCPEGSAKPKKLKEFLAARKIPRSRRQSWPVIEIAGEIAWVRGFPPAARFAPSPLSGRFLVVEEAADKARPESE